jgi:hypothetical protein
VGAGHSWNAEAGNFSQAPTEGKLSDESLALFDRLSQETAHELKVLSDLDTIRETEMAIGTGIEYQRSTPDECRP